MTYQEFLAEHPFTYSVRPIKGRLTQYEGVFHYDSSRVHFLVFLCSGNKELYEEYTAASGDSLDSMTGEKIIRCFARYVEASYMTDEEFAKEHGLEKGTTRAEQAYEMCAVLRRKMHALFGEDGVADLRKLHDSVPSAAGPDPQTEGQTEAEAYSSS